MKREIYLTKHDQFSYGAGNNVAFALRIDALDLASLVLRASRNKTGTAKSGPLTVVAKKLPTVKP